MKGATYIVYKRMYSEKAKRAHGSPYVWKPIYISRLPPPQGAAEFFRWMWMILEDLGYGEGWYRIMRTCSKGEKSGWKGVAIFYITKDSIYVRKKYSKYKGIPGMPEDLDLFFKARERRDQFTFKRIHLGVL